MDGQERVRCQLYLEVPGRGRVLEGEAVLVLPAADGHSDKGALAMVAEPGIHRIEVTTLGDLLDLRAAELGEHLAMVFPDHQVTYAGLAERADFFARGLIAAGLRPGQTVGILLPNCVDAIAALFGAAKAGLYPSRSTPATRAWNWPT